jgi:hypothetical protein
VSERAAAPPPALARYFGATHDLDALVRTHLFILAPANSGTTFLQAALATCRRTWNLSREGQHTFGFAGPSARGTGLGKLWAADERAVRLFADPAAYDWEVSRRAWYFLAWSRDPRASVFVEKSPPFLLVAEELRRHFRNARFLILVRNPHAVIEGVARRLSAQRPEAAADRQALLAAVARHVATCFAYQRRNVERLVAPASGVFFTYEEMCARPAAVAARIRGLVPELDDLNLDQRLRVKDYDEPLRDMNEQQVRRLSAADRQTITAVLEPHRESLAHFGYDPAVC